MPLSVHNGTLYNYGRDRLGSVTGLVSTGGTLNTSYRYDPYGSSISTTGTAYNALRYTGVYFDSATNLYRMTQRYYQPRAGRFTQLDPLPESIISINRYAYTNCNPTNFIDPDGLDACSLAKESVGNTAFGFATAYGWLAYGVLTAASGGTLFFAGLAVAGTAHAFDLAGRNAREVCNT